MKWRNDQLYHLRQKEILTKAMQDNYFHNVVAKLFDQEQPNQILFSFLKDEECIGYGGLVHINWIDKNAEVSFLMNTELEKDHFADNWTIFLSLLEKVGFEELKFHKLYTYAFDLRPNLYPVLEKKDFNKEAILKQHFFEDGEFKDVVIHSKIMKSLELRPATADDIDLTYSWINDREVRKFAFNSDFVSKENHEKWFMNKLSDPNCLFLIATLENNSIGSFRIDIENDEGIISFLLDPKLHGRGLGKVLLNEGIKISRKKYPTLNFVGYVLVNNKASVNLFRKLGFIELEKKQGTLKFISQ
jgi:RimJ/RimL family protein N-acetyltransferase